MGFGEQAAQLGKSIGDAFRAGPESQIEALKLRDQLAPKKPTNPNDLIQGQLVSIYNEKDPVKRQALMQENADTMKLLGPRITAWQRYTEKAKELYGDPDTGEIKGITGVQDVKIQRFRLSEPRPKPGFWSRDTLGIENPDSVKALADWEATGKVELRGKLTELYPNMDEASITNYLDNYFITEDQIAKEEIEPEKAPTHYTIPFAEGRKEIGGKAVSSLVSRDQTKQKVSKTPMTAKDKEAYEYAQKNQKDPAAKKILQKLKDEGKL